MYKTYAWYTLYVMYDSYEKEVSIAGGILLFLILAFVALVSFSVLGQRMFPERAKYTTVYIDELPLRVEIARTKEEKSKGMTGKRNIPWNSGILFVFEKEDKWRVSMEGMNFALDVFWLDHTGRIVYIEHNAQTQRYDVILNPDINAMYILEMRADFADVHNIDIGDIVKF